MNYIVGNWKSNKRASDLHAWFEEYSTTLKETEQNTKVVLCPSGPLLSDCATYINERHLHISLGAQDISPFPFGAYTGEVAARTAADWAEFAIVGHSERRRHFGETDTVVAQKVAQSLDAGLTPIVCVDEPYLHSQLAALDTAWFSHLIFAFEPVSAIGTGTTDTPSHAASVASRIHAIAGEVAVLYGGSVDADNLGYFLNETSLSGSLVGGASLNGASMAAIVQAANP